MKAILKLVLLFLFTVTSIGVVSAVSTNQNNLPEYTTFRSIDKGTFNEYRYKLTQQFFSLREFFEVNGTLNPNVLREMVIIANNGYQYLPDNLKNQNYLKEFLIQIQKGINNPSNEIAYTDIVRGLANYLEKVDIQRISGTIEANPQTGNAPLTSTFRANISDPTGSQIIPANYTWWVDNGGQRKIIGRGVSINYTFRDEGRYTVFLDVTSSHKNSQGYTDVLPFQDKIVVTAEEKVATVIMRVNSETVSDTAFLKFNPDTALYGLVFDATSSLPTGGARFTQTIWDFGNGIEKSYSGPPRVERVRYANQGEYKVKLVLQTNEGKRIEKNFNISIFDPVAKIEVNRQEGFIGDKFTFSTKSAGSDQNITYSWEIFDIQKDRVISQKSDRTFTYIFDEKGKYNVRLNVRKSSGELDQDTFIVSIESRNPIASFLASIKEENIPNRVFFDATQTFDPDMSDNGRLEYTWFINGERVTLEEPSLQGSTGYYTFPSVGTYVVNLEVTDPDGLRDVKQEQVKIDSILSVNMFAFPRVIQREGFIKFVAESPEAQVYEWDFGDGKKAGGSIDTVTHTYNSSGNFEVTLKVSDKNNITNTIKKTVYVSNSESPFAFIDTTIDSVEIPEFESTACKGVGAYIVNRVQNVKFDAKESINIDGQTSGLEYSWKIGNSKFSLSQSVSHRFDEVGCFPVSLTVRSSLNGKTDKKDIMLEVRNTPPTLTALDIKVQDETSDPIIVDVSALGAKDLDGVVQSYMWYYYTDIDNEPQDFRATRQPSTTFVLPKITGNYYFVAILKDNNETRITSEEATGSRHFITLTGDNINTPLIELSADNNSISVGDEVNFSAKVQNILGQNIEKGAVYHWDFNGDGFYNMQTSTPTASYVYRASGEYFAKVKVSYRGISATRNITINVANKLAPDFGYFSIGENYIFFDMSGGQIENRTWDMGDGTTRSGNTFNYQYSDGKTIHDVTLTISEGTKTQKVQKKVIKNIRNILKARKPGLVIFTYPEYNEDKNITLETLSDKVFLYLSESSESAAYAIDYDIEYDSNLNGGRDDDEDNKGTASYINGSIIEIPLNGFRRQIIRVFLKDKDGNITASDDIVITKEYLEDTVIDPETIIFENVSESEKQKLEQIKMIMQELPQQERLKALQFIQKLQESWNDATEKTRLIIDFENFIFELQLQNEDEIIALLESLLIEGQEDQSQLQVVYQALINLVPQDITCTVETGTCYDNLISKLSDIRNSEDIEFNKARGKEILEVIASTDLMTSDQKLDFKAILTSLVYGGDIGAIPVEEKDQIIAESPVPTKTSFFPFGGIILKIATWILSLGVIFLLILGGVYIIYFIKYRNNQSVTFRQFITRNTELETESVKNDIDDILVEVGDDIGSEAVADILSNVPETQTKSLASSEDILSFEDKKTSSAPKVEQKSSDQVPDWLKGSFQSVEKTQEKTARAPEIVAEKTEVIPEDTFKNIGVSKNIEIKNDTHREKSSEKNQENEIPPEVSKQEVSEDLLAGEPELPLETNIPDWLKGSFDTPSKTLEEKVEEEVDTFSDGKTELGEDDKTEKTEEVPEEKKPSIAPTRKQRTTRGTPKKKDTNEEDVKNTVNKKEKPSTKTQNKTEKKEGESQEDTQVDTKDELWNDGMKIPDWLKSPDDTK